MQKEIHPVYFGASKVTCSCGASFAVGSTKQDIQVEICSNCHPFFTGNDKVIDTAGRVEKFKARREKAVAATPKKAKTKKTDDSVEA